MSLYCFRRLSLQDQHISDSQIRGVQEQWSHRAWETPTGAEAKSCQSQTPLSSLNSLNVSSAPQMLTESMLSPPHSWEHLILPSPENCPSGTPAYPSCPAPYSFLTQVLTLPSDPSYPHPGSCAKLCSCVIAQPWSHPWNAARVKFSQDPPGWSLLTCPARSHSCLCWWNTQWSPAAPRLGSNRTSHLQLWGNSFFKWRKKQAQSFTSSPFHYDSSPH